MRQKIIMPRFFSMLVLPLLCLLPLLSHAQIGTFDFLKLTRKARQLKWEAEERGDAFIDYSAKHGYALYTIGGKQSHGQNEAQRSYRVPKLVEHNLWTDRIDTIQTKELNLNFLSSSPSDKATAVKHLLTHREYLQEVNQIRSVCEVSPDKKLFYFIGMVVLT